MIRRHVLLSVPVLLIAALLAAADPTSPTRAAERVGGAAAEVWQEPQPAYRENPTNPLAGRRWGVYLGPQDQVYAPYATSGGVRGELRSKIALRPRTKW